MSVNSAIDYHDVNASTFSSKYNSSPDFIQRKLVWSKLLSKYVRNSDKVLDAGCGSGIFSFIAASNGATVVGVDGSQEMVNTCERTKSQSYQGKGQINFFCSYLPADEVLQAYNPFDVVISSSVVEYIEDAAAVINALASSIKACGYLIISFPNKQSFYRKLEKGIFELIKKPEYYKHVKHIWTVEEMRQLMATNDLKLLEYEFYGNSNMVSKVSKIFGEQYSNNICVAVFKKK